MQNERTAELSTGYLRKNNNEFALMKKTHFYVFQINIQSVKKIDDEVRQS